MDEKSLLILLFAVAQLTIGYFILEPFMWMIGTGKGSTALGVMFAAILGITFIRISESYELILAVALGIALQILVSRLLKPLSVITDNSPDR